MKLHPQYPASFPVLLLAGFALVALPLLGGMINASYMLERVVTEGRHAVDLALVLTRSGRQLVSGVSDLQRAAGQYYLFEDAALQQAFRAAHRNLRRTVVTLLEQPLEAPLRRQVDQLAAAEMALYAGLLAGRGHGGGRFDGFAADFDRLYRDAVAVELAGQALVERRIAALGATAEDARRALFWQALAMIPLSLFLTVLFSWLISRPVRHLETVIRRLGEDDLAPFAAVEGPRDLAFLGERLDWLRLRLIGLEQQQINFLRHVSHELKTPLANLREGVSLLADGVVAELSPEQLEVTGIMSSNLRELQRRIEDLIHYSRVGSESLARADLALADIVAVAVRRQELALGKKSLQVDLALNQAHVLGDRGKLESVFENLLGNAIHFSPLRGHIALSAQTIQQRVAITLCDQGPGVQEEDRALVFNPFYQGRRQPPGALSGSGLGLSIVKEYVEAHGGRVHLLPPGGAGGACFQVMLPGPGPGPGG